MKEELIKETVNAFLQIKDTNKDMSLRLAAALISCVEEKARDMSLSVVIAVADAAARPVAIHCMDGAYIGSYDVALNKTYTAAAFRMTTEQLGRLSQPGESLYGIQFTNEGKIVIFGGGVPLFFEDRMIGALGVSGGSAEQDTELAEYGSKLLKEVIACQ